MECFGTTDFDNNSRLITLSAIIISGPHSIYIYICSLLSTSNINNRRRNMSRVKIILVKAQIIKWVRYYWKIIKNPLIT